MDNEDVDRIAARVVAMMAVRTGASPWLSANEAAGYLRCPLSRVRKLTMTGGLPVHREGGLVLYRHEELDQFVADGGGRTS